MKKNYIALLTITELPKTKSAKIRLVEWLRNAAKEINKSDPKIFAEPCRFRLMK